MQFASLHYQQLYWRHERLCPRPFFSRGQCSFLFRKLPQLAGTHNRARANYNSIRRSLEALCSLLALCERRTLEGSAHVPLAADS